MYIGTDIASKKRELLWAIIIFFVTVYNFENVHEHWKIKD